MTLPRSGAEQSTGKKVVVNIASLASASLWRIGVAFVIQVAIARRLGAAALGEYATVLAWLYVAQICLEAGLPAYFVRRLAGHPELRRDAHRRILRIQVVLAIVAWGALIAVSALVPALRSRLPLMAIAGASLPFYAVLSASSTIFEASERMDRVFFLDTAANTVLLAATLLVLWYGGGVAATLGVLVAAQVVSALLATLALRRGDFVRAHSGAAAESWRATLAAARPFFYVSFADVLQQRADLLLLSALASPQVAGVYAAANALVRILIKVTQAYWRALYPTLSRLRDGPLDRYRGLSDMAQRFVLGVTLPAALIGASLAAAIVDLIYGAGFAAAAPTLAILLLSAPLYAWEVRGITVLLVEHAPRRGLWIAATHLLVLAILLPPMAIVWGAAGAGLAATISAACGAAAASLLARALPIAPAGRRVGWMALGALACAGAATLLQLGGLAWWAAGSVAIALYGVLLPVTGALTRDDVRRLRSSVAPQGR